ncbi:MAG TPA: DUF2214 family protein [Devosiaceae bacterium]|jgi:putative membrane protein
MTDLVLAIAHHLVVFTFVALIAAEVLLLRPGITGERLAQLGRIDAAVGLVATFVLVVGFLRVFFGAAGSAYYFANWAFWAKLAAFAAVGLLSVVPTLAILRWRKAARADTAFAPPLAEVTRVRRFFAAEAITLILIPTFAAMMARGYGSF